jgi:hypothetical protein
VLAQDAVNQTVMAVLAAVACDRGNDVDNQKRMHTRAREAPEECDTECAVGNQDTLVSF